MRPDLSTRKAKTIAVIALPVFLIAAFALATYTPLFHARDVTIDGAVTLSRDRILALAGIGPDTNVFHLDTGAAAASLETDPWVESATVERHLPGTVVIRLRERTPVARSFVGSDPIATAIAGDGVVLPGAPTEGFPEIRASVGDLSVEARTGAATALAALKPLLRGRVSAVVAQPSGTFVMDLDGGLVVRYGDAGEDDAKAAALRAVLAWAADQGAPLSEVDVTVPQAPSAMLADGSTVTP
jgi:cell division protein FtsQ